MTPERVYATLLFIYPRAFRREYGRRMIAAFRRLRRESRVGALAFSCFIASDLLRSGFRERLAELGMDAQRAPAEWIARCVTGAIVSACAAHALAWTFSYLYHPYLEGIAIPAWVYGALLGLGLGAVQSAGLGRRTLNTVSWTLTSGLAGALGLQVAASFTGPLLYGCVLGAFIGMAQRLVLRSSEKRADTAILISMSAVALATAASVGAAPGILSGLDPIAAAPAALAGLRAVAFFDPGLASGEASDPIARFALLAICMLLSAAFTSSLLSSVFTRRSPC